MSCLDERSLLALAGGEGGARERTHLAGCSRCIGRAARLGRDLDRLRRVLLEARLPSSAPPAAEMPWLERFAPAMLALVMAVALGWGALATRADFARHEAARAARARETTAVAGEIARALFAVEALDPLAARRRIASGIVDAALRGEHPCERSQARCSW